MYFLYTSECNYFDGPTKYVINLHKKFKRDNSPYALVLIRLYVLKKDRYDDIIYIIFKRVKKKKRFHKIVMVLKILVYYNRVTNISILIFFQSALPQAVTSFVYAQEYGLHAEVLSTA